MAITQRTYTLPAVWAQNATTTVPGNPSTGTAYRYSTVATYQAGQKFKNIFESASWNEMQYQVTGLNYTLERTGILPYSASNDYYTNGRCVWTNGRVYRYIGTDGTNAGSPTAAPSYWALETFLTWSSTIQIYTNDIIYYNGALFYATQNSVGVTPGLNSAYYQAYGINSHNIPNYFNSTTTYGSGDMVWYGGQLWRSRVASNTGHTPALTDGTYWQLASLPTITDQGYVLSANLLKQPTWDDVYSALIGSATWPFYGAKKQSLFTGSYTINQGSYFVIEAKAGGGGGGKGRYKSGKGGVAYAGGGGEGETLYLRGYAKTANITISGISVGYGGAGSTSDESAGSNGTNTTFTIATTTDTTNQGIAGTFTCYAGKAGRGASSYSSSSDQYNGGTPSVTGDRERWPSSGNTNYVYHAGESGQITFKYRNEDSCTGTNFGYTRGGGKWGGYGWDTSGGVDGKQGCGGGGNSCGGRGGKGGDGYFRIWLPSITSTVMLNVTGTLNPTATTTSLTVSGGTSPYTWSVLNGNATLNTTTGATVTVTVNTGVSTILVVDSAGNSSQVQVQRISANPLSAVINPYPSGTTMPDGVSSGSYTATVTVTGGTSPYTYNWNNPDSNENVTITSGATSATVTFTVTGPNPQIQVVVTDALGNQEVASVESASAATNIAFALGAAGSLDGMSAGTYVNGITSATYSGNSIIFANCPVGTYSMHLDFDSDSSSAPTFTYSGGTGNAYWGYQNSEHVVTGGFRVTSGPCTVTCTKTSNGCAFIVTQVA